MIGFRPTSVFAQPTAPNPFAGYVAIAPDGTVTIYSAHMDMGQGIYHGTATLVNEELMADWSQIRVEGGSGNPVYYGNIDMGRCGSGHWRFDRLCFRRLTAIAWPAPRRA